MKSFIVFALFVAAAVAVPVDPKDAQILRYENDNLGLGPFGYAYETSDGTAAQATGVLKNAGTEQEATEVRGQFSYIAPDGLTYVVTYIADENGFQPSAPHLPVGPK